MLILTRKPGESLYIGDDIKITIVELKGHQIRVGIDAPPEMRIYREEIYLQILEENKKAAEAPLAGDLGLENLTAAWAERKGALVSGGGKGGSDADGTEGDESKPALPRGSGLKGEREGDDKPRVASLSGFFTSRPRDAGPQVVIKRKRSKKES